MREIGRQAYKHEERDSLMYSSLFVIHKVCGLFHIAEHKFDGILAESSRRVSRSNNDKFW